MADNASEIVTVTGEGLTLSRLIWRRFKTRNVGYLEKVLDINPGIAAAPFLPVGAEIVLPVSEDIIKPDRVQAVRLWD